MDLVPRQMGQDRCDVAGAAQHTVRPQTAGGCAYQGQFPATRAAIGRDARMRIHWQVQKRRWPRLASAVVTIVRGWLGDGHVSWEGTNVCACDECVSAVRLSASVQFAVQQPSSHPHQAQQGRKKCRRGVALGSTRDDSPVTHELSVSCLLCKHRAGRARWAPLRSDLHVAIDGHTGCRLQGSQRRRTGSKDRVAAKLQVQAPHL